MDRTILSRGTLGRGAGRGSLASRDNSQPSSREPSESRKSRDDERSAVSKLASHGPKMKLLTALLVMKL